MYSPALPLNAYIALLSAVAVGGNDMIDFSLNVWERSRIDTFTKLLNWNELSSATSESLLRIATLEGSTGTHSCLKYIVTSTRTA